MKSLLSLLALGLLACGIYFAYTLENSHNISITLSDSDDIYQLSAQYNKAQTGKVQRYINESIAPNGLFSSENDYFDATTDLQDKTRFYIKSSPGKLLIKFNKNENSTASYNRIKKMCEGVKKVLAEK